MIVCTQCPAQSTSPAGATSCNCSSGFEGNPFVACTACPAGKFKASLAGTCATCPDGAISQVNGRSACETCGPGTTQSANRTRCETCPDGTSGFLGRCDDCPRGFYSNVETNKRCVLCPSGFYSTAPRTAVCTACRACPDGYHRTNCTATAGGGSCQPCLACPPDRVNVGCMNRAGNTDKPGACRNRAYVARTPLCDQSDSGLGLGGYTFLGLFGVSQDDASFQCRRRCDNQQNIMSDKVYDNATYTDLVRLFPSVKGIPRAFNGGHCGGPYACDVANCNIPGSADDSQTDYQPQLACPVYIEPASAAAFWAALDAPSGTGDASVVAAVNDMRAAKCQTCAACGQSVSSTAKSLASQKDWGRGCARDCTQLACAPGLIFDWTESDPTAKCKTCGDLDDVRLCLSSEQSAFAGYDVSGRLPKIYMKNCAPKRQLPLRGYETGYGSCVKCADFDETGPGFCTAERDTYYHTCELSGTAVSATCRPCLRTNGRDPLYSRFWDGAAFRLLYCQQPPCAASDGLAYTGVSTEAVPHRICASACKPIVCENGAAQVVLPCVLPHQARCRDAVNMDAAVTDPLYVAVAYAPAHANILEPVATAPHLFASFENALVDHDATTLSRRAVCVWNADFIPDNSANPAGVSSRFQSACRPWARDPRAQYPLMPLQNTVAVETTETAFFPRRVLLNTSASAVAYSRGPVPRPFSVFSGDVYLELDLDNTNNATLAAFVPTDRGIEAATWVPRWRAAVHARQLSGDATNLSLSIGPDQTCFGCFQLGIFPDTTTNFTTTNLNTAMPRFRGDKFIFSPAPDLFVCPGTTQARAYPLFLQTRFDASLSAMFTSSLTDACVAAFGVRAQNLGLPQDLVRSSPVLVAGTCVLYAFSSTRTFCVKRTGGVVERTALNPSTGTLVDLAVHDGVLVRTEHSGLFPSGDTSNYISLLSTVDSTSESVVQVAGLIMFARAAPWFFLRRTTATSLRLSKFETQNANFRLNATATYQVNDVRILFSQFVPVSAKNTLLEYSDGVLVFATAKCSGTRVVVFLAALDVALAPLVTYSMPLAVFAVENTDFQRIDDPYESVASTGEAFLSCTFLERRVLLLSVAVEAASQSIPFAPLVLNLTDLALIPSVLDPDLARAFDAPFVRAAGAVLAGGGVKSCSECTPATADASSGFFAYGAAMVSYRQLLACTDAKTYIEENTARSMPVRICEMVVTDTGNQAVLMQLTLKCVTSSPLEIVLQVPPGRRVFFGDTPDYIQPKQSRLLLSASCTEALSSVTLYDSTSCATGCRRTLISGGRLRIQGGVEITSVRHRPTLSVASETWDRRTLLQIATPRALYAESRVAPDWGEYSVVSRSIAPLQQLAVRVQRAVSVAWLASSTSDTIRNTPQRLALDALSIVPVLSEHFAPFAPVNATAVVATIVYLPTRENLNGLGLEAFAYGDDVSDWQRVHASLHLAKVAADIANCAYLARVVAVDDALQIVPSTLPATGCLLDLASSPQCHLELPVSLANAARVVGVSLAQVARAGFSACRALTDADDVSVELAPFMRIAQCPPNAFLHTDTLACAPCDVDASICPAGQYVRGCNPLSHPAVPPTCVPCPAPNNSVFANTSRGCAAWTCRSGFHRKDETCARCTSLLRGVCRATGGLKHQNCTQTANEACVDCAPKPRYSEWFVTPSDTSECSWRCKTGFFQTAGACEACQTFAETAALLDVSGAREADRFYRFAPCTSTAQARADVCLQQDYWAEYGKYGDYVRDGDAFGNDCLTQCYPTSRRPYTVHVNQTIRGETWSAFRCIACPDSAWPLDATAVRLPSAAFTTSTSCVTTCVNSLGYYAHANRSNTCLYCPSAPNAGACPVGFYFSSSNNCAACQPCARALAGSLFNASGAFNDPRSCAEFCPAGSFAADALCRPHSVLACLPGLQFAVAGTPSTDARCDTCADCAYAQEVSPCTPTADRRCASCDSVRFPLDAWSSAWSRTGCELVCRTDLGYTKLFTSGGSSGGSSGEVCRKCLPCPIGQSLPARPTNCTCIPCTAAIPPSAVYTAGCAWACPLYHVARVVGAGPAARFVCEYTVPPSPQKTTLLRVESPLTCPSGQRLAPDPRPAAYAALACANCTLPAGLRAADLNRTWTWTRTAADCAWACAWGLEKQERRLGNASTFACEALRYAHARPPPATSPGVTPAFQLSHVVGLVVAGVVCAVFALCFLGRMLA